MSESSRNPSKLSTPSSNSEIEDEVLELTDIDKLKSISNGSDDRNTEVSQSRPKNPITVQLQLLSQHFRNLWSSPLPSSSDDEVLENDNNSNSSITVIPSNDNQIDTTLKQIPDLNVDIIEEEVKKELEEVEKLESELNRNVSKKIKILQPSLSSQATESKCTSSNSSDMRMESIGTVEQMEHKLDARQCDDNENV